MQDNQNNQNDNSFLLEKKDKCCGQKCDCHKNSENGDFMDNSIDCPDTFSIYAFILFVILIIIGVVFAICSVFV